MKICPWRDPVLLQNDEPNLLPWHPFVTLDDNEVGDPARADQELSSITFDIAGLAVAPIPLRLVPTPNQFSCHSLRLESYGCHIYDLQFVHVHLAMRRFYHGPQFGIPVRSLRYKLLDSYLMDRDSGSSRVRCSTAYISTFFSMEARICPSQPSLCLRIQKYVIASREDCWRFFSKQAGIPPMKICVHSKVENLQNRRSYALARYARGIESPAPRFACEEGRCDRCDISWKLDFRMEDFGLCLVLTRWMDLGPGRNPSDPRWSICL
jgi:hypothetical protein